MIRFFLNMMPMWIQGKVIDWAFVRAFDLAEKAGNVNVCYVHTGQEVDEDFLKELLANGDAAQEINVEPGEEGYVCPECQQGCSSSCTCWCHGYSQN